MCLPLLVWASTAVVFLVKPGYSGAFHQLGVKTYPLTSEDLASLRFFAHSARDPSSLTLMRTQVGLHAMRATSASAYVRDTEGALLAQPTSAIPAHSLYLAEQGLWVAVKQMSPTQTALLLRDAQTQWPERYGTSGVWLPAQSMGLRYQTDTHVVMQLHLDTLTITQSGVDTQWINRAYRWHYLQWTGVERIDRILALLGLALLVAMTLVGVQMLRKT